MVSISNEHLDMEKIANSGQIFRFNKVSDNKYSLVAKDKLLYIKEVENKVYNLSCSDSEYENYWKEYFDMNTDYENFIKKVPKKDEFLTSAIQYGKGIRILKQDKWEMLISFIISQRKSIPAIKSSIEKLSKKFGKQIEKEVYAFPSPKDLANASIEELNECSLGYRSEYIKESAGQILSAEIDLEKLNELNSIELINELIKLKGVGIKVANCVALFAYYRIDTFPIDVWIQRVIDKYYGGKFPLEKYKGYEGVLQQYMFYYGKEMKI